MKKLLIWGLVGIILGGCQSKKTSQYFSEDICKQIPKEMMAKVANRSIIMAKKLDLGGVYNCAYYLDDKNYILLVLDYGKTEDQITAQKAVQREMTVSNEIMMKNMVVWQPDGMLNSIYLIFNDNKFLTIERSAWSGLYANNLISLASNLAKEVKDYK